MFFEQFSQPFRQGVLLFASPAEEAQLAGTSRRTVGRCPSFLECPPLFIYYVYYIYNPPHLLQPLAFRWQVKIMLFRQAFNLWSSSAALVCSLPLFIGEWFLVNCDFTCYNECCEHLGVPFGVGKAGKNENICSAWNNKKNQGQTHFISTLRLLQKGLFLCWKIKNQH